MKPEDHPPRVCLNSIKEHLEILELIYKGELPNNSENFQFTVEQIRINVDRVWSWFDANQELIMTEKEKEFWRLVDKSKEELREQGFSFDEFGRATQSYDEYVKRMKLLDYSRTYTSTDCTYEEEE